MKIHPLIKFALEVLITTLVTPREDQIVFCFGQLHKEAIFKWKAKGDTKREENKANFSLSLQ